MKKVKIKKSKEKIYFLKNIITYFFGIRNIFNNINSLRKK